VLDLGAQAVVDYTDGDWVERVRAVHPEGVDAVLSCRGGETKRIAGRYVGGTRSRATLDALAAEVDAGRLRPSIERTYPLGDAAAAQVRVADGHVRGKLVITLT
jgi:NADPH:quinone reductase-like Zn-dependent oxidoreductase